MIRVAAFVSRFMIWKYYESESGFSVRMMKYS